MKRTTRLLSLLLVVILCLSVLPVGAAAMSSDGWTKGSDGNWYYWENGSMVTGWKKISGTWYYFSPYSYNMLSDCWLQYPEDSDDWYYFKSNGAMAASQWVGSGSYWYYQLSSGKSAKGWLKLGGVWYYFDPETGMMAIGGPWEINGKYYYFKSSGALYTGWQKITYDDGTSGWWYFTSNGAVENGWKKISGKWYYFEDFEMVSDYWLQYPDGSGDWYYFNASGAMVTNTWVKDGGWWYFQLSDGRSAKGWKQISGVWYYFAGDEGYMATGGPWYLDGKYYYFKNSGALFTGWKEFDGGWMYFTSNGAYANTTKKINGKSYTFNADGICLNP